MNKKETTLVIKCSNEEKKELKRLSSLSNLSMTDYVLKNIQEKKFFTEQLSETKKTVIHTAELIVEDLTNKLLSIKEDTEQNNSEKTFREITISSYNDMKKGDLLIIHKEVLEIEKIDYEERKIYITNLSSNKKFVITFEKLTEDSYIVKRKI